MIRPEAIVGITKTVARNSFWYGVESLMSVLATLAASVLVAREFGPSRLGNYNFVVWLAYLAGTLGSVGIPITTRKFMAEFLGQGNRGQADGVFWYALRFQAIAAAVVMLLGIGVVCATCPRSFWTIGICLVLSVWPRMLAFIPSQANMAREEASANLPGAVAGTVAQLGIVYGTLYFGWDLIGLACSHLAATSIECSIKLAPAVVRAWQARSQTLPEAIVDRMVRFSRQGLALVAITVVLGSRTDLFFLKMLNTDERQISFFSTSMTLMERLVLLPESFAGAAGVSMMAQQGRDPQRLPALTALSSKYLLLVGMPMLVGASLVSQAIWAVFGPAYAPAAAVFSLLALFGCFRLLALPPQAMLQASENQRALVWFGLLGGMVNMAVDIALIPRFGALGAAIGFGTGQAILAASNWVQAWRLFGSGALPARGGAIVAAVALMAIATRTLMARELSLANLAVTIGFSAVVYLAGIRGLRVLDGSDRARLSSLIPGSRGFSRALRSGIGAVTAE